MYDELLERLHKRIALTTAGSPLQDDLQKAADAIEELHRKYIEERNAAVELTGELANKPRWIPVTERLPDILHTVIVSGRMKYKWERDYSRFVDVATYTAGEFFETFNDWYEGQDEFEITHWMPLPEPPKEE